MAFGPLRVATETLVAMTTASRLTKSFSARRTNSSRVPVEYMLPVSKKLIGFQRVTDQRPASHLIE
jgi:hypothetical protein